MRPTAVSRPARSTRISSSPFSTVVPAKTVSPAVRSTGSDSPVIVCWFTSASPLRMVPSTGNRRGARTITMSPACRAAAGTVVRPSPSRRTAVSSAATMRSRSERRVVTTLRLTTQSPSARSHVSSAAAGKLRRAVRTASVEASSTSPLTRPRARAAPARSSAGPSAARRSTVRSGQETTSVAARASTVVAPARRTSGVDDASSRAAGSIPMAVSRPPTSRPLSIWPRTSTSALSASRNGSYSIRTLPVRPLPSTVRTPGTERSVLTTASCRGFSHPAG